MQRLRVVGITNHRVQNWDLTQVCDRQDALVFIGQQREVGEPGHQLYLSDLPKTT